MREDPLMVCADRNSASMPSLPPSFGVPSTPSPVSSRATCSRASSTKRPMNLVMSSATTRVSGRAVGETGQARLAQEAQILRRQERRQLARAVHRECLVGPIDAARCGTRVLPDPWRLARDRLRRAESGPASSSGCRRRRDAARGSRPRHRRADAHTARAAGAPRRTRDPAPRPAVRRHSRLPCRRARAGDGPGARDARPRRPRDRKSGSRCRSASSKRSERVKASACRYRVCV